VTGGEAGDRVDGVRRWRFNTGGGSVVVVVSKLGFRFFRGGRGAVASSDDISGHRSLGGQGRVDRRQVDGEEVRRGRGGTTSAMANRRAVGGAGGVEARSPEEDGQRRMDGGGQTDDEDDRR
jgi:hypothetical protein